MKKYLTLLAFLSLILSCSGAFAQKYTKSKQYTSIGGSLNAMNYFGDITPSSSFTSADVSFTRPNIGLHIIQRFTPRLSVRAAFAWGRLRGDDFKSANITDDNARYRYIRNAHFRNDIKELSVVGMLDLFENRNTFLRRPNFTPYIFGGVAVFHHNPKAQAPEGEGDKWIALQPLGTEGQFADNRAERGYEAPYKRIQLSIPAGLGLRYKVSPRIDVALELGYRFTFTDYLDDVSGNYPDLGDLKSDLARKMSNRTLEPVATISGDARDVTRVQTDTGLPIITYTGSDGQLYDTVAGFGQRGDQRGEPSERDWYLVTGVHLNYILIKGVRCPKFR